MKPLVLCAFALLASCGTTSQLVNERTVVGGKSADHVQLSWSRPEAVAARKNEPRGSHGSFASVPIVENTDIADPPLTTADEPCAALAEGSLFNRPLPPNTLSEIPKGTPIGRPATRAHTVEREERGSLLINDRSTDATNFPEWNTLCTIAFGASVAGFVSLFIVTLASSLAWLIVAGFLLGIVGLVQASVRDQRGKGLAVFAIVLPVALLILVLVVYYNMGGWGN